MPETGMPDSTMPNGKTPDNGRSTRNAILVEAQPYTVYRALVEPELVEQWLAPGDMTAQVHAFEAREGGEILISLHYPEGSGEAGKSGDGADVYRARFVELVPQQKVVQVIEFESDDEAFSGEMRMTVSLDETKSGTHVTVAFDNIPEGISLADNRLGTELSLQKLSALVSRPAC